MSNGECYKCKDNTGNDAEAYSAFVTTTLTECKRCSNRCYRQDVQRCGEPGKTYAFSSFVGYAMDPAGSGNCVCATGYHMENNTCVAD